MELVSEELLVPYCRVQDFNATTGECTAIFWGPKPGMPALSVIEGAALSAAIGAVWAFGYFIKQSRRVASV